MSGKKRKAEPLLGFQDLFDSITDLLIQIKPQLSGTQRPNNEILISQLSRLANFAESFTEQRPRSNKNWLTQADDLDREGVNLWNMSGILRQGKDHDPKLFAALRLAAFRLVQAGLEQKPDIETLLHVLQLASKTGSALSDIANHTLAGAVLGAAAKIEEDMNAADDPNDTHAQSKACASIVYYTCRMEAVRALLIRLNSTLFSLRLRLHTSQAWKEGNKGVAQFMLCKIIGTVATFFPVSTVTSNYTPYRLEGNDSRLSYLSTQDREQLASKILEIGKAMAREQVTETQNPQTRDAKRALEAIKWIRSALTLVEKTPVEDTPSILELKRAILRNLARVYYLASSADVENLDKAEATLCELISSVDNNACDKKRPEFQQVRWMRLAVLKRKHAPDHLLLEGFQSIIEHLDFTEAEITDVLQELRAMAQHHLLVTEATQQLLEATLASSGRSAVDKIFLSLIFHCSRDPDHERAIKTVQQACSHIAELDDFELPKVPAAACQSLLWQFGDRLYNAKAWNKAADWYLLGTHEAFKTMAKMNYPRCLRKAALCYIQQREYARATAAIRSCRSNEASTHYVAFLIAVHQGFENEAIRAVRDMVQAKDFDRKMLLLATQLAHDANLKSLLLTVLESLLTFLRSQDGFDNDVEALTMIRCIIRLVIELLKQPVAELRALVPALIGHFRTAQTICEEALRKDNKMLILKDISWLWRTAYNTAVQGCAEWDDSELHLADLFDLARAFMEAYRKTSLTDQDLTLQSHVMLASFSSLACRVFAVRRREEEEPQHDFRKRICRDIEEFKAIIDSGRVSNEPQDSGEEECICAMMHVVLVFEAEQRCILKDWNGVLTSIEEAAQHSRVKENCFEAIADILWLEKDCPVNVLYTALEAILQACLNYNCMSVEKFSRWLRGICTILLAKNTETDRVKAIGYIEQAVTVIEDSRKGPDMKKIYPEDEKYWLLSTAYNTGVECLAASHLDEAKRWFESAAIISRYVPDSNERARKISEAYSNLLARYGNEMRSN
ncbi:hypothetical protein M422DRAFT_67355 [Sphaerobolus stellatus SS14]|uniref:Protein ZIP4 homolog n=1 Tax=Sphaerobolus stellatus (strain SS14) TaxID=990650 RepID=A0A0C9W2G0_SPHS4|nr:hypothetical protein M422DRAFT_67355 [Sphaerobolus stellatus SS14]